MTYNTCFGLDDWIYFHLIHSHNRDYGNYSAIAILHTFQFTVAHALGISVFTSRVLATDLSQSHCHFNSHMKSSWHSLIFLAVSSQSLLTIVSRTRPISLPTTVLSSFVFCLYWLCHLVTPGHVPKRKHRLYCWRGVFSRRCLAIDVLLFRTFASAGMCLASRSLVWNHITIRNQFTMPPYMLLNHGIWYLIVKWPCFSLTQSNLSTILCHKP
jgi:hypothetical protein